MFDLPIFNQAQNPPPAVPLTEVPPGPPIDQRSNFIVAGLKTGYYNTLAAGAGALSGGAKLLGADDASASLGQSATQFQSDAAQVGRPDIDKDGWTGGGIGGFVKKLGYTAAQAVPMIGGAIGGGLALGAGAEAAGIAAPAALTAIAGASLTQIPLSFGEQVNSAAQQPGGLTKGTAGRALAQAVPVGIAQSLVPGEGALLAKGGAGILGQLGERIGTSTAARFAEHGITNAAVGALGSGLQAAADDSFDPALSAGDRAANIVHAATQGAVASGLIGAGIGGVFGGQHQSALDERLARLGLDPKNPSRTTPAEPPPVAAAPAEPAPFGRRPPPVTPQQKLAQTIGPPSPETYAGLNAPPTMLGEQTDLAHQAPPEGILGSRGIQYDLFSARPYYAGVKPPLEMPARGTAPAEPAPTSGEPTLKDVLKTPPAPPPNAFIRAQLKAADIGLSGKREFKKFVANSTATDPVTLYNELRAVPEAVANDKKIAALRNSLQVDVPDLPEQLAAAQADPKTPPAELARLKFNLDLRAKADELLAQQEAAKAAPAPAEAPEPAAAPIEAVAAPDDIPELSGPDEHTTPAVPTDTDAPRAAEAASDTIQTAGPSLVEPTPDAGGSSVAPAAASGPKTIAERVLDVARHAAGPRGGDVDIAQIRAALPDIAPKDFENALREIHLDDSEHVLVPNPKGQRTGVDGVSVPGQGRLHKLSVAEVEGNDAVQVGGAAPQALGDQPQGGAADGGGDAAGAEVARAGETLGAEAGPQGAAEPVGEGAAQAPVNDNADDNADEPFVPATSGNQAKIKRVQATLKGTPYQDLWNGYFTAKAAGDKETAAAHARELAAKSPTGEFPDPHTTMREQIRFDATNAKLAPADPTDRSPEQAAQTAAKNQATANILAAAPEVKAASKPIVTKLRRQTRAKTALIETPEGTQIPTEAVGGTAADIPQILASSVDPIVPAGPAEPIAKTPFGRVAGIADNAPVVPREQVDAHVAKFVAKLRPDVQDKIHVLDSADQHDPVLQDAAARAGLDLNSTSAIFHDGQVFIHANQMRNLGEVEDTLSHEIHGHMATAQRFAGASDYQTAMSKVFDRAGGAEGIERLARERGIWDENDDGKNLNGAVGLKSYLPPVDDDQVRARNLPGGVRVNTPTSTSLLTPLYKTRIVDELIAHSAGTTPSALDRGIQAIQDMVRKAIVNTLRRAGMANFARTMDKFTQAELSRWLADSRKALAQQPKPGDIDLLAGASDPRMFIHDVEPTGQPPFMARLAGQQRDAQGVHGLVGSMLDHIRSNIRYKDLFGPNLKNPERATAADQVRAARNYTLEQLAPANGIAEEGAIHGMTGLKQYYETAHGAKNTIETRIKQLAEPISQAQVDLKAQAPEKERDLANLMAETGLKKLDPDLPFNQHTWLARDNTPEQVEALRGDHARLVKDLQKLGQPAKGGIKTNAQQIFRDQRAMGNFQWYMNAAQNLHNDLVQVHGVDPGYSPAHRYAGLENGMDPKAAEALFRDVGASRNFAAQAYQDMMAAAQAHLTENGTKPENAGTQPYKDLTNTIANNTKAEQVFVKEGPYFRIGRRGEFTVSGKVKGVLDADGQQTDTPDPEALKAIADHVNEHFPQVSFGLSNDNRSYFARFEHQAWANDFANLFQDKGPLRQHIDEEHGTRAAKMSDSMNGLADAIPALQSHIDQAAGLYDRDLERLGSGPSYDALKEARDNYIGNLRASLISLRGDNSMSSILSRRQNVQAFSSDMARNQQEAAAAYARDIAFTATHNHMEDGLAQARDHINQTARSGAQDALDEAARNQRIYDAFQDRNKAANIRVDNTLLSWTRRFMHPFQLAMSPAYVLMNASQLGTLTLPELVKFHGYGRSTAALANALLPAGRVIASMVKQKGIFEGGITKAVLDGARLGNLRDWTSTMSNHGHFELGGFTANQDGLSYGSLGKVQKFLHFANSTALLAETYTRLIAAYAAKDLHDNLPQGPARQSMERQFPTSSDYAGHVVQQTMMAWGNANTPKFMTAGGPLGKASPTVFQFHGWTPRLMEKLYRETYNGVTNRLGEGAEADQMRAEARSFMKAHLAAVALLSGGLGLPFLSTALGAGTRASSLLPGVDQPIDLEAGLRDFLSNTFGKDMGTVLARGLPRYLGTDMAELGDKDFFPFARLIEDRKPLEDAIPDYASHAWGSSVGMATNVALAVREMSEGRVSEAAARALPTSLRNLVRASRVAQYGYTNQQGTPLPVPAGPAEVAKTALGMQGGQLAEERDRQGVYAGLQGDRRARKALIQRDLSLSMTRGDQAGMQAAMDAARRYDQDNPGERYTSHLRGFIDSRQRTIAYGNQLGTPKLRPADKLGRELTNF